MLLFTSAGKAVRFPERDVRAMGRTARGVRGVRLKAGERLIALLLVDTDQAPAATVLMSTERGYGKRTDLAEFPCHRRGGQGVIAIRVNARNGLVVSANLVNSEDEVMLITDAGTLIRTRVAEISVLGRATQGVRLINLHDEERLASVQRVEEQDNGETDAEPTDSATPPA